MDSMISIPKKLLDRIAEIDLDELASWVDPSVDSSKIVYEDIDAIGDLIAYMRGD